MKRAYSTAALGLAILLSVLASACDNTNGILSSIQTETASSSTTSTFYRSSVQTFARLGGYYYATLNAIYRRPAASAAGSDWSLLSVGDLGTNYYCRQLAVVGTTLYAVLRNKDTNQTMKGVYSSDDGSSWTEVDTSFAAKDVEALYVANGQLFAVTNEGTSSTSSSNLDKPKYYLYHFNSPNFEKITTLDVAYSSSWIPGVAYAGSTYWTAQGSAIYSGDGTNFSPSESTSNNGTCSSIAADTSRIYVGTTYGYIYGTNASTISWETATPWGSGSSVAAVKALIYIPLAKGGTPNGMLVAGRGMQGDDYSSYYYGYYEVALGSSSTAGLSSSSSYLGDSSSAVLNGGTTSNYDTTTKYLFVNGFYYDTTANRLFILNNSSMRKLSGLWSNHWDGSLWTGWVTE